MSTSAKSKSRFTGRVGGITYTDPALFEEAAQALGYCGYGKRAQTWKVGTAVGVVLSDGTRVEGQVWAMADVANYAWLALDNGQFVAVYMPRPESVLSSPLRGDVVGRVAA